MAAVGFLCLVGCGGTPESGLPRVRMAVGGQTQLVYLPTTLTERLGHFRAEGVDVTLTDFPGGAKALEALWGGSADVVSGFYDHTIQMAAEGRKLKAFVVMQRLPGLVLVVSPATQKKIESVKDLRGAVVGVSSPGSSTSLFLRYLLLREGVKLEEVSETGIGMAAAAIVAMESGKVDAAVMADPAFSLLEGRKGRLRVLSDTRTADGVERAFGAREYPAAVLYSTAEWMAANRAAAEALARAVRRSLAWMQQSKPEEIAAKMPPEFAGGDVALYTASIGRAMPMYSRDGRMPAGGPETVLRALRPVLPKVAAAQIDLADTFVD